MTFSDISKEIPYLIFRVQLIGTTNACDHTLTELASKYMYASEHITS